MTLQMALINVSIQRQIVTLIWLPEDFYTRLILVLYPVSGVIAEADENIRGETGLGLF